METTKEKIYFDITVFAYLRTSLVALSDGFIKC